MRSVLLILAGSLASGFLLALTLPPNKWFLAGFFALSPMLAAVRGQGFLKGFIAGLIASFTLAVIAATCVLARGYPKDTTAAWLYTGCGLFGFVISLVTALFAETGTSKMKAPWFAAVAVLLETILLAILPASLALTQAYGFNALSYVGGIWIVSFVVWLVNLQVALSPRKLGPPILIVAGLFLAQVPIWISRGAAHHGPLVRVVQSENTGKELYDRLATSTHPALTVLPEFSGMETAPRGDTSALKTLSERLPPFVTTFEDDFTPLPHNAAALFDHGTESKRYFKQKLFGGEVKMHTAGEGEAVVVGSSLRVALLICYDSCFPLAVREAALEQPDVIALPTIDPPSPGAFIARVHAAFTPFRALESGVPIARADGYAASMIVDSWGRVLAEVGSGEASASANIDVSHWTPYRVLGDWVLAACFVIVLYPLVARRIKRLD